MSGDEVVRQILVEIERNPTVSQRNLADRTGISVGMINWHIKRCVSKGLVKLQQAPLRRYFYYLTPAGFVEKAELTARFLQSSFSIFRLGKEQYEGLFASCAEQGWNNVALVGNTELTDLALMVAPRTPSIRIAGVIDQAQASERHHQDPPTAQCVSARELLIQTPGGVNAAVVCHFMTDERAKTHQAIIRDLDLDTKRLLVPEFLT